MPSWEGCCSPQWQWRTTRALGMKGILEIGRDWFSETSFWDDLSYFKLWKIVQENLYSQMVNFFLNSPLTIKRNILFKNSPLFSSVNTRGAAVSPTTMWALRYHTRGNFHFSLPCSASNMSTNYGLFCALGQRKVLEGGKGVVLFALVPTWPCALCSLHCCTEEHTPNRDILRTVTLSSFWYLFLFTLPSRNEDCENSNTISTSKTRPMVLHSLLIF